MKRRERDDTQRIYADIYSARTWRLCRVRDWMLACSEGPVMNLEELKQRLRQGASFYHAPTTWNEAADAIESLQRELATIPPNCVHVQLDKDGRRVVGIRYKDESQLASLNELAQDLVRGQ